VNEDLKFVRGQAIYNYRCYFCHGYSGDAKTLAATYLKPPPVAFTALSSRSLSVKKMKQAVFYGKKNTAMMSFKTVLSNDDVDAVVYFVRKAFMKKKLKNSRYHTEENGWVNHEKYQIAYPFATGKIPLDTKDEALSEEQRRGKQLFFVACVTCHDRGKVNEEGVIWSARPLSWPRNNYSHKYSKDVEMVDEVSEASPYAKHDIKDIYIPRSTAEKNGQIIFQNNCAFCHAPDGSAKHWLGRFIAPHPKNFLSESIRISYTKQKLKEIVSNGKDNTAMPAWRYVLTSQEIDDVVDFIWNRFE